MPKRDTTFGIHLNDRVYGRNMPAAVWNCMLRGNQVLSKGFSYQELGMHGRPLLPDEVLHFTDTARRIVGLLGLVSTE